MDRVKRIWYLSPLRAAKVQASLRIRAVSPEPPLLAHTCNKSRGTFRQKARSLAPLNGWACAVKICHDGMLEDTNSLDGAHIFMGVVGFVVFQSSGLSSFVKMQFCRWLSFSKMQFCGYHLFKWDRVGCLGLNTKNEFFILCECFI